MPLAPMPSLRPMAVLCLLLTLGPQGGQAAPAGHQADHEHRAGHPNPAHTRPMPQPMTPPPMQPQHHRPGMPAHPMQGDASVGVQFSMAQHHAAMVYFAEPGHQGFVPPGLAKKGGLPPGQARSWQRGRVLPAGVVYYALPRSLELVLGPPPAGHRYVRVATDILLLAIGTGLVVDALEDLVR